MAVLLRVTIDALLKNLTIVTDSQGKEMSEKHNSCYCSSIVYDSLSRTAIVVAQPEQKVELGRLDTTRMASLVLRELRTRNFWLLLPTISFYIAGFRLGGKLAIHCVMDS